MPVRSLRFALVPAVLLAATVLGCSSGGESADAPADMPAAATPVPGATSVPGEPSPAPTQTSPPTSTLPPAVDLPPVIATVVGGPPSPPPGATAEPPAASASDGAATVALGLGSYCWTPPAGPGLCADAIGVITAPSSLRVATGDSLLLGGPLLAASVEAWSATAWVRDAPVARGDDWLAWVPWSGSTDPVGQPLALDLDASALTAPARPGSYLVSLSVSFPQGDATYGLLLEVERPADGGVATRSPVFVESAALLILESLPIQLRLEVRGQLPTPCNEPRWEVTDDGATIAVTLWSVSDPATSCIQVLEPLELSIPLGTLVTGERTVTLNGETVGAASTGG